jgi:predicted RNA-binding protein
MKVTLPIYIGADLVDRTVHELNGTQIQKLVDVVTYMLEGGGTVQDVREVADEIGLLEG